MNKKTSELIAIILQTSNLTTRDIEDLQRIKRKLEAKGD